MAPTVVLLHGFSHTGASWDPVIERLGESYRALAPDLRGHGSAAGREPVNLGGVVDDISGLSSDPFTLVGYSMGGRIALHFALARPAGLRRVLLIGASPGIADDDERAQRRREDDALAEQIERSSIEEFAERWARTPVLAGQPASVTEAAHRDRLRNTPDGLSRALRGLGAGALPSLWGKLPELRVPLTLLTGERDQKFTEIARAIAQAVPGTRCEVAAGAGHAVHLEAPQAVAELISGG